MTLEMSPWLELIFVQSLRAALLILGILLMLRLLGNRISPAWRHAVWGLVPLQLILVVSIPSPVSVWNVFRTENISTTEIAVEPDRHATVEATNAEATIATENAASIEQTQTQLLTNSDSVGETQPVLLPANRTSPEVAAITPITHSAISDSTDSDSTNVIQNHAKPEIRQTGVPVMSSTVNHHVVLFAVWIAGCVVMLFVFLRQILICRSWLRHGKPVTNERVLLIFEECCHLMRVKTWLVIAESKSVSGPFLVGAIRPTLLLPNSMIENASSEQLKTVFLHELSHLKRWDIWTSWLMTLLLIVHWFNPLLWLAIRRMNAEREEACDLMAIAVLNRNERTSYSRSLIDIAERFVTPAQTPGFAGISETGKFLQRRIEMIKQSGTWKLRWKILATSLMLIIGAVTLTDAQEPSKPGNIVVNGIEYAPVKKAEQSKELVTIQEQSPKYTKMLTDSPEDFPHKELLGRYIGSEGDDRIGFAIGLNRSEKILERDEQTGEATKTRIIDRLGIVVYDDGLPKLGWNENDDDRYEGIVKIINENEMVIELEKYFDDNKKEKPVPEALKKLTAKIVRDGDNITLEIPKNREWDAVRVTKVKEEKPQIEASQKSKVKPPVPAFVVTESRPIIHPDVVAGKYLGWEEDDRMGVLLEEGSRGGIALNENDKPFLITFYEDGLPGNGYNEKDDDRYEGYAVLKEKTNNLEITLERKFDDGREERVPETLKNLTATMEDAPTIEIANDGNKTIGRKREIRLTIPKNREWDAVRMVKQK